MGTGAHRRDPLHGIHYVCDFDAKGRSNDEDEPMRSTWTDKATGKVIDLHNYAYAGMSGWGGYNYDFAEFIITAGDASNYIQGNIIHIGAHNNTANIGYPVSPNQTVKIKVKVEGVSACVANGDIDFLNFYMNSGDSETINKDGSYDINVTASNTGTRFYIYAQKRGVGSEWTPLSTPITIEQLPSYPGALVCDGIDDYGQSAEAIDEEVGTMLAMLEADDDIKRGSYFFNCGKNENANRLYCWTPSDGIPKMGLPSKNIAFPVGVLTRTPSSPADIMYIASYSGGLPSKVALYRLILIREKLDDEQVEFLKSKVIREYNEWCRDNGYDYAIING